MKYFRLILTLLGLYALCSTARAEATYEQMQLKADRLFNQDDWIPAGALYNYMMHERPTVADNYGRAIIASYAAADSVTPMQYLSRALEAHVPLDSVLTKVKTYAFAKSRANLYEQFMLRASEVYPWLARPLEPYLLNYFTSRRNAPEMIRYATTLLQGLPQSAHFLSILAQGYMLNDQYDLAADTWIRIIDIHPDNFDALINLATYYQLTSRADEALPYFRRAYALHATPYVAEQILRLTTPAGK